MLQAVFMCCGSGWHVEWRSSVGAFEDVSPKADISAAGEGACGPLFVDLRICRKNALMRHGKGQSVGILPLALTFPFGFARARSGRQGLTTLPRVETAFPHSSRENCAWMGLLSLEIANAMRLVICAAARDSRSMGEGRRRRRKFLIFEIGNANISCLFTVFYMEL
jgi:hypothetical protein